MMLAGGLALIRERDQQYEPKLPSVILDPGRVGAIMISMRNPLGSVAKRDGLCPTRL